MSTNSIGTTSDWEDDFQDIKDFKFDTNNVGVQINIPDEATPYNVFNKLWDDEVMQLILKSSKKYGEEQQNLKRPHTKKSRVQNFNIWIKNFFWIVLVESRN